MRHGQRQIERSLRAGSSHTTLPRFSPRRCMQSIIRPSFPKFQETFSPSQKPRRRPPFRTYPQPNSGVKEEVAVLCSGDLRGGTFTNRRTDAHGFRRHPTSPLPPTPPRPVRPGEHPKIEHRLVVAGRSGIQSHYPQSPACASRNYTRTVCTRREWRQLHLFARRGPCAPASRTAA